MRLGKRNPDDRENLRVYSGSINHKQSAERDYLHLFYLSMLALAVVVYTVPLLEWFWCAVVVFSWGVLACFADRAQLKFQRVKLKKSREKVLAVLELGYSLGNNGVSKFYLMSATGFEASEFYPTVWSLERDGLIERFERGEKIYYRSVI